MFRAARLLRGIRSISSMAATNASTSPPRVPIPPRGVNYRGKVVLAPMVRSGELPMRLLSLHYGADLVWGPETVDRSLIGATRRLNPRTNMIEYTRLPSHSHSPAAQFGDNGESVIYRLDPAREAGKLVFQLGTADPERAVAAARFVAPDVYGIDVNAGCPKPFSVSGGMGAALLRTPDRLVAILEALVKEIVPEFNIGISVKIRILETAAETEALVRRLVATGITGLTVHCRTTPMRPRERAIRGQLRMIADVCREAGVACLMNGDVEGREQAGGLVEEYGVDGAMIATAAEKNPSCFRTAEQGGMEGWEKVVKQYMRFAMEVENKMSNTKFSLTQLVPGKAPAYKLLTACRSYVDMVKALEYEEDMVELATQTDKVLGLGEFEVKKEPKQKQKQKGNQQQQKGKQQQQQKQQQQESKKRKREGNSPGPEPAKKAAEVLEPAPAVPAAA